MNSLLWKQWHESKGYLAIFMVWMSLAVCYCVSYEIGYRFRASVGHFSVWASVYATCAAVFLLVD